MLHISDDAEKYGGLDNCGAFEFENYLQRLKKMVRSGKKPLTQIVKRIKESQTYLVSMDAQRKQNEIKVSSQQSDNAYLIGQNRFCQLLTETNNRDEDGNAFNVVQSILKKSSLFPYAISMAFSYAVVEFTNDDPPSVAIVHQGWLDSKPDGMFCYWPRTNVSLKARKAEIADKEKWVKYSIRILHYTDTYESAIQMCRDAQYTSNLSSDDNEEMGRGQRTKQQNFEKQDSKSDADGKNKDLRNEEEMNVSKKKTEKALTPNAPVLNHQQDNQSTPIMPLGNSENHQQDSQSTPIMPLGNSENHQQDSQSTPIMPLGNSERRKERRREIHILPDLPEEGRLNLPEKTQAVSFERIVLSTLKHVVKNQENIQAELALISGAAVDDEIEDLLPSPVNSLEDFIQWGIKLEEKQSRKKLASFLIAFGGATCLETVRNTLKKTVTNNILALYSLRGKKGKKVFQDHNLYRVLIRACFKLHKCKRQEIEDCMIEVLKHAPHMPGGPKYKKPASRRREDISDSE
ncbi:unnamed protein product [Mytilus coruscus]|uniref:DUF4806 domain-containing protein n=1 Tax=Mytilus coruscus TaxID=42192 RepID=A0A6J8EPQ3_MYTCO|nr:unnamed protein product [Mytilus coruscus]